MGLFSMCTRGLRGGCFDTAAPGAQLVELLQVGFVVQILELLALVVSVGCGADQTPALAQMVFPGLAQMAFVIYLTFETSVGCYSRSGPDTARSPRHSVGQARESHWDRLITVRKHCNDAWRGMRHIWW